MEKKQCKTVFVSDIHLGNPKNQSNKLIQFLDSISFKNLIIIGDFIDYRQLNRFGKRGKKETDTLNYINNLSKNGVKITYIQGNHDRTLKCGNEIKISNMTILRDLYYITGKGKKYYVTHGDCMDGVNKDGNIMGEIGSIISGFLLKMEYIRNKNVYKIEYVSIAEKLEEWIKKIRMPRQKIDQKIKKFSRNIKCDGFIIGHFHLTGHSSVNGLEYFNTGDRLKNYGAVIENLKGDLELIEYKPST